MLICGILSGSAERGSGGSSASESVSSFSKNPTPLVREHTNPYLSRAGKTNTHTKRLYVFSSLKGVIGKSMALESGIFKLDPPAQPHGLCQLGPVT